MVRWPLDFRSDPVEIATFNPDQQCGDLSAFVACCRDDVPQLGDPEPEMAIVRVIHASGCGNGPRRGLAPTAGEGRST